MWGNDYIYNIIHKRARLKFWFLNCFNLFLGQMDLEPLIVSIKFRFKWTKIFRMIIFKLRSQIENSLVWFYICWYVIYILYNFSWHKPYQLFILWLISFWYSISVKSGFDLWIAHTLTRIATWIIRFSNKFSFLWNNRN